ncbi:hypothetical protein AXG93_669s1160 [Marchantia polymorpha subsp. ruderalis]|uniref:Kinesin motor domain-containing protein n=1 Tax=Marchantia polymorpha subsp. ruderalis TaxID=1480154 RepID=A0A176WA58_MARPO|nr:hypothetical protein AXG93_669s1160 [Marchantia polymorpha subsp. ruderalis]
MENILVSIRVRPLNKQEASKGTPWKLTSNTITLNSGSNTSGQTFTFDRVFGTDSKTADIYDAHTKRIISSTVQGFNGTIFAYGQTSSGKTYTMRGSQAEPGIIPLAIQDVFRNIEEVGKMETNREFLLRVSYMEIYNEEIKDLLAPENSKLQVHESVERGIFVAGLREEIVVNPDQVLQLMEAGEAHRHIGETNMNLHSSRSHTIFRMVIESRDRSEDDPSDRALMQISDPVRVSHLNLVDLAGSERVNKTGAEGARLKEGTHINKSLMTLGNVINKLSEGIEKQGGHVPYRDSKLTRILQPALGGNAKTLIVCNITPAMLHVDETRGTLQFASRANRVTNCAQVNEIMTDAALLKRQKKEIEELRKKLQESPSDHWEGEILNLRNELLKTELEKERMAMELLETQKAQAERERRIKEQQQKIENLSTMVINSAVDDRDLEKRAKKGNRRETWCARPLCQPVAEEFPKIKRAAQKDLSVASSVEFSLPVSKKRSFGLPPPFEKLMEDEESMSKGVSFSFDESLEDGFTTSDHFPLPEHAAQSFVGERRRRSSNDWVTGNEMKEKESEIEQLKRELSQAHSFYMKKDTKQRKSLETDKRGKSLDGWKENDSLATIKQLRTQVRQLETEKLYMQRELDSVLDQAREQSAAVKQELQEVYQELNEAKEESTNLKSHLSVHVKQIHQLQIEKRDEKQAYLQLAAAFKELKSEVDCILASPNVLQSSIYESHQAITRSVKAFQECVEDARDLSAMATLTFSQGNNSIDFVSKSRTATVSQTQLEDQNELGVQSTTMVHDGSFGGCKDITCHKAVGFTECEGPQISKKLIGTFNGCGEEYLSVPPGKEDKSCLDDLEVDRLREENRNLRSVVESLQSELIIRRNQSPSLIETANDEYPELSVAVYEHESWQAMTIEESDLREQTETNCYFTVTELGVAGPHSESYVDSVCLVEELKDSPQSSTVNIRSPSAEGLRKEPVKTTDLHTTIFEIAAGQSPDLISSSQNISTVDDEVDRCIEADKLELHNGFSENEVLAFLRSQLELAEKEKQSFLLREAALEEKLENLMATLQALEDERSSWTESSRKASELLETGDAELLRLTRKLLSARLSPEQAQNDISTQENFASSNSDNKLCILEAELDLVIDEKRSIHEAMRNIESKLEVTMLENARLLQREGILVVESDQLKESLQLLNDEITAKKEPSIDANHDSQREELLQREASLLGEIRDLKACLRLLESEVEMMKSASLESECKKKTFMEREASLMNEINELKASLQSMQDEIVSLTETSNSVQFEKDKVVEHESALAVEVSHLKECLQLIEEEKSLQNSAIDAVLCKLDLGQAGPLDNLGEDDKLTRLVAQVDMLLQEKVGLKDSLDILQKDMYYASTETERLLQKEATLLEEVMSLKSNLRTLEEESNVMMIAHQQQEAELTKRLTNLQEEKDKLMKSFQEGESQILEFRAAAADAFKDMETWQQRYQSDSSQFRSEIMALRKELSAAKAAPAGLVKERDTLYRDLEKIKVKAKDTEAKLKSTLQDKSKLETEKVNMERELKQLRQSNSMQRDISRRDSVVDQRRQSIALGLNKTKNQLYCIENALQVKTEEVERLTYELHAAKESYSKLEFAMAEAESYLKEQLAEVEKQVSQLSDEKAAVMSNADKLNTDLQVATEQCKEKIYELGSLQDELRDLRDQLLESESHIKAAELSAAELAREKEEIVQELIDAHINFQKEKADLTSQAQENRDKCNALNLEIIPLTEELLKVKKLQEETMESNRILQNRLQEALEANSEKALIHHKQVELLDADVVLYKDRCRQLEKEIEDAVKREQDFRLSGCSQLEKLRDELQSCKMKLSAAEDAEQSLSLENRTMLTSNTKLQVALDASRDRLEVFEGRLEESDWELTELKSLLQKAGIMRGNAWNLVSLQQFEKQIKTQNEAKKLEAELASKKLEMIELEVEYENMRGQCEKYQEEIEYLQKKVLTPEEEMEHKNTVAEMAEQNRKLQDHLRKAEDKAQEFTDMVRMKEASLTTLQTTLEGLHAQNMRLEKELNASRAELQSAQQLNKLALRAGAIGKATTPMFKSARQDKLQAQSTGQSTTSLPSSLGRAEQSPSSVTMEEMKETTSGMTQSSPVLRRIPLGENAAVTSVLSSEGKGARSFLTSSKLPQSARPGPRGFHFPDSRYNLRRNKENWENI